MAWFVASVVLAIVVVAPLTILNQVSICRPIEQARLMAWASPKGDLGHQAVWPAKMNPLNCWPRSTTYMQESLQIDCGRGAPFGRLHLGCINGNCQWQHGFVQPHGKHRIQPAEGNRIVDAPVDRNRAPQRRFGRAKPMCWPAARPRLPSVVAPLFRRWWPIWVKSTAPASASTTSSA